jgi:hypothetical protein
MARAKKKIAYDRKHPVIAAISGCYNAPDSDFIKAIELYDNARDSIDSETRIKNMTELLEHIRSMVYSQAYDDGYNDASDNHSSSEYEK